MWVVAANFRRTHSQSIGLVWGLAATRRSGYIHQMNQVNSPNDFVHDDSTINIVVVIIIKGGSITQTTLKPYTQTCSVGGSRNAAFWCQCCSSLLVVSNLLL